MQNVKTIIHIEMSVAGSFIEVALNHIIYDCIQRIVAFKHYMIATLDLIREVAQICGKQQTAHILVVNNVSVTLTISVRHRQGLYIERPYAIFVPNFEDVYAIKLLGYTLARIDLKLIFEGIRDKCRVVFV